MAEPVVVRDCRLWLGPYALQGSLDAVNLAASKQKKPSHRMGDIAVTYVPGPQEIDFKASGFWASDAIATSLEPDTILYPRINPALESTAWPMTLAPPNAPSATPAVAGNVVYTVVGKQYDYNPISGNWGDTLKYDVTTLPSSSPSGRLYRGVSLAPATTYSATTSGTAVQAGAVSATQKFICVLHVFALNGGTWTVTVESDNASNFPSATTRATFTGATAITTQVIETNGAVTDDWWRIVVTETVGGTDVTLAAAIHISPQ